MAESFVKAPTAVTGRGVVDYSASAALDVAGTIELARKGELAKFDFVDPAISSTALALQSFSPDGALLNEAIMGTLGKLFAEYCSGAMPANEPAAMKYPAIPLSHPAAQQVIAERNIFAADAFAGERAALGGSSVTSLKLVSSSGSQGSIQVSKAA